MYQVIVFTHCPLVNALSWQNYRELRNKVTCVINERKNAYFSDHQRPLQIWSEENTFRFTKVSNRDIEKYLSSQHKKSNNDILGMDVVLLKEPALYISESLARVINKSLESAVFEQDWKNARVSPIYKDDGNVNDENNCRPISVIGHIAKMDGKSCELSTYWFFGVT